MGERGWVVITRFQPPYYHHCFSNLRALQKWLPLLNSGPGHPSSLSTCCRRSECLRPYIQDTKRVKASKIHRHNQVQHFSLFSRTVTLSFPPLHQANTCSSFTSFSGVSSSRNPSLIGKYFSCEFTLNSLYISVPSSGK